MNLALIIYIGIAGALGSISRHLVGVWMGRFGTRLPWGTFTVNVVGSFVIGFVMITFLQRGQIESKLRFALTTGFLGGFTTYSAFALETVTLLEDRRAGAAALYVSMTLVCAGLAAFLGILAARALR